MTGRRLWLALGLALSLEACDEKPPPQPGHALVTLFTLQGALAADVKELGGGLSKVFPGMPPAYFLAAPDQIRIATSYTNGRPSPYLTTDIWMNYPAVWVQPMYVFVTAWDSSAPLSKRHPKHSWVMGLGPQSAFYSPFWQTFYVELDANADDGTYKSVREILAAGLPIHRGPARLAAVLPPGMKPQPSDALPPPFDRALASPVSARMGMGQPGSLLETEAWLDGETVSVLDFGPDRFEWNERGEIVEQPLFFFFHRTADGKPAPLLNAPRVGGAGPVFAQRPALAPANRPLFGSYWRLYAVHLPPGRSIIFIPTGPRYKAFCDAFEDLAATPGYTGPKVVTSPADWPAEAREMVESFALKLALETPNSDCFKTPADLPKCQWLHSQETIERLLPSAIQPSEVTVACPYLGYAGMPVPRLAP